MYTNLKSKFCMLSGKGYTRDAKCCCRHFGVIFVAVIKCFAEHVIFWLQLGFFFGGGGIVFKCHKHEQRSCNFFQVLDKFIKILAFLYQLCVYYGENYGNW